MITGRDIGETIRNLPSPTYLEAERLAAPTRI